MVSTEIKVEQEKLKVTIGTIIIVTVVFIFYLGINLYTYLFNGFVFLPIVIAVCLLYLGTLGYFICECVKIWKHISKGD